FFPAEDGIRAFHVTGVQTCALPIYLEETERFLPQIRRRAGGVRSDSGRGVPVRPVPLQTGIAGVVRKKAVSLRPGNRPRRKILRHSDDGRRCYGLMGLRRENTGQERRIGSSQTFYELLVTSLVV